MYTKCPRCHKVISFDPPANVPAGQKLHIKCPNPECGVTISILIPPKNPNTNLNKNANSQNAIQNTNKESQNAYTPYPVGGVAQQYPPYQQTFPQYPYTPYNGYTPYPQGQIPVRTEKKRELTQKELKKKVKEEQKVQWTGSTIKSLFMLLFSLIFIAFHVIGSLILLGTIKVPETSPLFSITSYNSINVVAGIFISHGLSLAPIIENMALLALTTIGVIGVILAVISVFMNFIVAISKKYSTGFGITNTIFSFLLFVTTLTTFFIPYASDYHPANIKETGVALKEYFSPIGVLNLNNIMIYIGVAIGLIVLILSIVFLINQGKPIRKGQKTAKEKKEKKDKTLDKKDKEEKKKKKNNKEKENKKDTKSDVITTPTI